MREGSKATHRRRYQTWQHRQDGEPHPGAFDWGTIFGDLGYGHSGKRILDLGPGDDILVWPGADVVGFDKPGIPDGYNYTKTSAQQGFIEGDINEIDNYFPQESFDCIHASQVFEHLHDPKDVMRRCLRILKPGGHLVITVPDFDLYEHGRMPSQFNPDHKTTWSLWRLDPPTSFPHIFVPYLLQDFHVVRATLEDTNYNYLDFQNDQTLRFEDGVEAFIEIIIKKP